MVEYLSEMGALCLAGERQGILFFAALYLLLVVGYSALYQLRIRRWPSTRGQLLRADVRLVGAADPVVSDREYATDALYEYTVAGEVHRGRRVSPWVMMASHNARFVLERQLGKIESNAEGTVEVFFDPSAPGRSFLVRPGPFGLILTIAIATMPIVLYALAYHT